MPSTPVPIAIVGIGCRFPGGAHDPETLWDMLSKGTDTWKDVPVERYNWQSFHHPNPDVQGSHNHRGGHFIEQNPAAFDARFFNIPTPEAKAMDPQQRILLEVAYESTESAGIPIEALKGSNTGVYMATFNHDYEAMMLKDSEISPKYLLTGIGQAILSNRISHAFDLKGPSLTIDTACSGSLVALHQACQSLRTKETDIALAGGTNLILNPDIMIGMSQLHFLNDDGKCYPFDSRGSGYGRGEGVAVVALKRLDDALRAGDSIRAVILNTGVGQDGRTPGITLPNGEAQQSLIRSVYGAAGIDPQDTGYIEAHGTGTVAGDFAEVSALGKVFGHRQTPLYVGSIKANVGHLESSSGIAGLIKAALMLEKGMIPPNPNLIDLKKNMLSDEWNITIPRKLEAWPENVPRRASVNSFGYGGTNAHAVLEPLGAALSGMLARGISNRSTNVVSDGSTTPDSNHPSEGSSNVLSHGMPKLLQDGSSTPDSSHGSEGSGVFKSADKLKDGISKFDALVTVDLQEVDADSDSEELVHEIVVDEVPPEATEPRLTEQASELFAVTAKSDVSLARALESLHEWVSSRDEDQLRLRDLAYTLASRRSIMPWRHCFVASTRTELLASLDAKPKPSRASSLQKLGYVFSGQGAQWFAMGRELIATSTVFRQSLERSQAILCRLGAKWNLIEELQRDKSASQVDDSEIGQPASTAIQVAIVDLFDSLGLQPEVVVGHSSGEIAAAYAAGALGKESTLAISYHRSFLARRSKAFMTAKGAMLAVGLGEKDISPYLARLRCGKAVVACANSPSSTTVSGDEGAIDELQAILEEASTFARKLKVDTAYHSHHMESVADSYLDSMGGIVSGETRSSTKFFSSVTGSLKTSDFGPAYWVHNLVSKVRFCDALEAASNHLSANAQETSTAALQLFVEVGPHAALAGPLRQTMTHMNMGPSNYLCLPSLVRGRDAEQSVLESVGKLFEKGYPVKLENTNVLDHPVQKPSMVFDLTPYPWDHSQLYWSESRLSKDYRLRPHPQHDLLGVRVIGSSPSEPVWRYVIGSDSLPWVQEHVVDGFATFPAAGFVAMALQAKSQITRDRQVSTEFRKYHVRDVLFTKALIIPDAPGTVELRLTLKGAKKAKDKATAGWEEFRVSSVTSDGMWHEHCHGSVMIECIGQADDFEASRAMEEALESQSQGERLADLERSQPRTIDSSELYEDLRSKGNYYGPNFAAITAYELGEREAVGTVVIPDVANSMPSNFMQPHIIHPSTFDALIHSCLPIFGQHSNAGSVYTVGLGDVAFSAKLSSVPGTEIRFITDVIPTGPLSAKVEISAFQDNGKGGQDLVLRATNGELQGVSDTVDSADVLSNQGMTYQLKWAEDLDLCKPSRPESTDQAAKAAELAASEKLGLLNQAASIYIGQCLEHVPEGSQAPQHAHFYRWMRSFNESDESQAFLRALSPSDARSCLASAHSAGVEGEALTRMGEQLVPIVAQGLDPRQVVLEDDLLFRGYTDDASSRCYAHLANYVKQLTFKRPDMTVLEVGAGTGGATIPLFQSLEQDGALPLRRYDFTDISSGFFDHAKPLLEQWEKWIQFKPLNIEKDPVAQGFAEASYDLIIASNAIHVTSSIVEALTNARRLLKPGGRLLLVESTIAAPFVNMLYGVLPEWYCGVNDGRRDSPLLTMDRWRSVLLQSSFNGIDFAANDYAGPGHRVSFLAAKAVTSNSTPPLSSPVTIVAAPDVSPEHSTYCQQLAEIFEENDLDISFAELPLDRVDPSTTYVLLDDRDEPILTGSSSALFRGLTALLTAGRNVMWINVAHTLSPNAGSEHGLMIGFTRTARAENESLKLVTVDMQECTTHESPNLGDKLLEVLLTSFSADTQDKCDEIEYVYKRGQLLIPRLLPNDKVDDLVKGVSTSSKVENGLFHQEHRPLKLHVETQGLLDSIRFVDDPAARVPIAPHEIEIQTASFGINFKDIMVALGQMKAQIPMVGECAGTVVGVGSDFQGMYKIGDRVCGWCGTPYASRARVHGYNAHQIPDSMPLSVAASVPVVFTTAWYGLVEIARLQKGQTVLIHAAAGGVGQAAIRIAQYFGAEIIATVGSERKKRFIMETFNIPESHIFSSRTTTFKKGILRVSHGKGVDVVLNSLSGELLRESWACVSQFGTFVEIGKSDIYAKNPISLEPFDKNVAFASVDLALMSDKRPQVNKRCITAIMKLMETGSLVPVEPVTTMSLADCTNAFRLLQSGKQIGKIVLEADQETVVKTTPPPPAPLKLDSDGTYIIAGGLGGLGLEIARFMAKRGAGHIVLLSRRRVGDEEETALQKEFEALGTNVRAVPCNISDRSHCEALVSRYLTNLPPVRGVIQAAMVLQDRLIEQMELDDFQKALQPKLHGTRNLHQVLDGPSLDFFVSLSSAVSVIGSQGSSNYAAGNAYQDAMAANQPSSGAHVVSINLGPMKETGILARNVRIEQMFEQQGFILLMNAELFSLLEYSMSPQAREDDCRQIVVGFNRESLTKADNQFVLTNPMFRHLPEEAQQQASNDSGSSAHFSKESITNAQSVEEAQSIFAFHLTQKISTLVVVDIEKLDENVPLQDLGMDSLILIELKNWIARNFSAALQTSEVADAASIAALAAVVAKKSTLLENSTQGDKEQGDIVNEVKPVAAEPTVNSAKPAGVTLPKQPVPDLATSLRDFQLVASAISAGPEFDKACDAVNELAKADDHGRCLHDRLVSRSKDPAVDNWFSDMYLSRAFLKSRAPLAPFSSFFGSLPDGPFQATPAERAAAISIGAYQCKQAVEAGAMSSIYMADQALDQDAYQWLFNAHREPRVDEDRMQRHPGNDYLVAFRHGRPFKVMLREGSEDVSYAKLQATFQSILDSVQGRMSWMSWVGTLTADTRTEWAQIRDHLRSLTSANEFFVSTIEAAAFIVCLDDARPETPAERAQQFFSGDGSNRWFDKTLHFIVCDNGASATLCEHTMLDGTATLPLKKFIGQTLLKHQTTQQSRKAHEEQSHVQLEELKFTTDSHLFTRAREVQATYDERKLKYSFAGFNLAPIGNDFFRAHKCSPKSGVQLVLQLACRRFFGYNPATNETVSIAHFHKGRVAVSPVVCPQVVLFCAAAADGADTGVRQSLFYEAAATLTKWAAQAGKGNSFARHLMALEWMVEDGEERPALFDDPVYRRSMGRTITTDCLENDLLECGGVLPDPESMFIHFQTLSDKTLFSIYGNELDVGKFQSYVEVAAEDVRNLLETKSS